MEKTTIVLVDDQPIFRKGLEQLLNNFKNMQVVGHANNGIEAIDVARNHQPDILILDVSMPKMRGTEALKRIKEVSPDTKVLVLSMYDEEEYIWHSLKYGASGYLLKQSAAEEFEIALSMILKGNIYLSPEISRFIISDWVSKSNQKNIIHITPISDREKQVLKLVAEGNSNNEIGQLLHISTKTVETHRHRLMKKLELSNLADLIRYAIKVNLIEK